MITIKCPECAMNDTLIASVEASTILRLTLNVDHLAELVCFESRDDWHYGTITYECTECETEFDKEDVEKANPGLVIDERKYG